VIQPKFGLAGRNPSILINLPHLDMTNAKSNERVPQPYHVLDIGCAPVLLEELCMAGARIDFPDIQIAIVGSAERGKIFGIRRPCNGIDAKGMLIN
jgi:hypothetical protein